MTTVEATLTRKFGICFSDARTIVTVARLNLDIMGYPNREQKERLVVEATTIFENYPEEKRTKMQAYQTEFEDAKLNSSQSSAMMNTSQSSSLSRHSNHKSGLSLSSSSSHGSGFFFTRR